MQISPVVANTLSIVQGKAEADIAIATALMKKEQNVARQQGEALVQLIQAAASISVVAPKTRGIDVRA